MRSACLTARSVFIPFALLVLVTVCGCGQPAGQDGAKDTAESRTGVETGSSAPFSASAALAPALPAVTDDPAALAEIEAAGARLKRDSEGFVVDIDLRGTTATDATLSRLTGIRRLRSLHLDDLPISDAGVELLAASGCPLAALDLRGCPVTDAAMDSLARIGTLRAIRMSGENGKTAVSDGGLAKLSTLPDLRVIAVDGLWIGTPGLQSLLPAAGIEELYLKSTLVDDESMAVAAKFGNLRKLRISKTQVSNEGLKLLTACRKLEDLDLSENSLLNNDGMVHVGQMSELKKLNLWRVAVSDAGIAALAELRRIEWLNLDNTQLSDAGLPALREMTALTFLHLGSTSVSDSGLPLLEHLTALRDLQLTRTAVTEAGAAALAGKLPICTIQLKYVDSAESP